MVNGVERPSVTSSMNEKERNKKISKGHGNGLKFGFCPRCGKKGYYKVSRAYEHCRFCGLNMILVPGQDF